MTLLPADPTDPIEPNPTFASAQPDPINRSRTGIVRFCGLLAYEQAVDLQRACGAERATDGCPDQLLLMEHAPVYTAGRTTHDSHWSGEAQLPQQLGIPVCRTERGGSITYHGPGQVVGYPILRLSDHCAGPKAYVHRLEEVLMATLADWGIVGYRRERLPGVWVGDSNPFKIAFIGVRISHGVTTHGFALNVSVDLAPFSRIVPCGIPDCQVTSMAVILGTAPDMHAVQRRIATVFAERFDLTWIPAPAPERVDSSGTVDDLR